MDGQKTIVIDLPNERATAELAGRLAPLLRPGDMIALWGDLGAGKTAFSRALIHALGFDEDVPSPTFTLLQTYDAGAIRVRHFDLYRIEDPEELVELGWDEAQDGAIVLVEWPGKAGSFLAERRLDIIFDFGVAPDARRATLTPVGDFGAGRDIVAALQDGLS